MDTKIIFAIVGMVVIATATLGLGAAITTTASVNRIGGDNNVVINPARANITALAWTEEVAADGVVEVDTVTFTVGNEHTVSAHTYQVCAVIEGPASTFDPAAAAVPSCTTTASIAANAKLTGVTLTFTGTDARDLVDISFSIEETA